MNIFRFEIKLFQKPGCFRKQLLPGVPGKILSDRLFLVINELTGHN